MIPPSYFSFENSSAYSIYRAFWPDNGWVILTIFFANGTLILLHAVVIFFVVTDSTKKGNVGTPDV
jgi:hypothetical protein